MAGSLWTHTELIVAFNLYCKTPYSKIDKRNPEIRELAAVLHRTPESVSLKLANFASLDPGVERSGRKGMAHGSKADKEVWEQFNQNWEELIGQSERILAELRGTAPYEITEHYEDFLFKEGKERDAWVKQRVSQQFFRRSVLASYGETCCITGLKVPELLVASHIVPWAVDARCRLNPMNGLCLNALHDRAFDRGLMTITPAFIVKISPRLLKEGPSQDSFFKPYDGKGITLPEKFRPSGEFLRFHNSEIFLSRD